MTVMWIRLWQTKKTLRTLKPITCSSPEIEKRRSKIGIIHEMSAVRKSLLLAHHALYSEVILPKPIRPMVTRRKAYCKTRQTLL